MKTVDDYMKLPEGAPAELIEGEIVMSPSPNPRHQRIVSRLDRTLGKDIEDRRVGERFVAPCDVHLPSVDIVQPDLVFISTRNSGIVQDWIRGVPDVVVEILSPDSADRDRTLKRALYERNGVPEYWIIDPQQFRVDVLFLRNGAYVPRGTFGPSDALRSPTFPDLLLPVASLLA